MIWPILKTPRWPPTVSYAALEDGVNMGQILGSCALVIRFIPPPQFPLPFFKGDILWFQKVQRRNGTTVQCMKI